MQPEEYRQASLKVWEAMAPGWERWRVHLEQAVAPVHDWLIRELEPRPGDTLLELASGTGILGFKVAGMIGDQGRIISRPTSPRTWSTWPNVTARSTASRTSSSG